MAFTVEDGSVVANANAYITVAEFRAHHTDRGRDFSATLDAAVQAAIVKATDYVDKRFGKKFKGYRKDSSQELEWPRQDVWNASGWRYGSDEIPNLLKKAISEYARLALALDDLLPIPARGFATINEATGGVVTTQTHVARTRQVVGPIEDETWYHDSSRREIERSGGARSDMVSTGYLPEYPVADEWLNQLVNAGLPTSIGRA